jgi:hypothetical protein
MTTTEEEEKGTAFESTRREQKRERKSVSLKVAVKEECKM